MQVGIIGGTGPAGRALAARLSVSGNEVVLGSRSKERGIEIVEEIVAEWPGKRLTLVGGDNEAASNAEIVVLATPWEAAVNTAGELQGSVDGKVVVSMVNAVARFGREFHALVPVRGSIAASVQAIVPDALVTTAFQHVPAGPLGDLDHDIEADILICADKPAAADVTVGLVESIPGLRGVKAGSLASANAVEALTAVLINVNVGYKSHVALRLSGLKHPTD